jgi:hypothetical protein
MTMQQLFLRVVALRHINFYCMRAAASKTTAPFVSNFHIKTFKASPRMFAHSKVGIVNVFLDSLSLALGATKVAPWPAAKGLKRLCKFASKHKRYVLNLRVPPLFALPGEYLHRTPPSEFPLQLARLAEILARVEKLKSSPRVKQSDAKEAFAKEDSAGKRANGSSKMHTCVNKALSFTPIKERLKNSSTHLRQAFLMCRNNGPLWS